ncbi:MAG: hydantoinase/oxoprolinase family protein, partial [Alphaproteobacteria bacterium]
MVLFVGSDIGGTFTDLVGYDSELNKLFFGKLLTNYDDLVEGVIDCMDDVGISARSVHILKHGTTQIINTLLERKGAKTALVTTRGFADILEIGRAGRPFPFDLNYARQPPLVPRDLRFEMDERMLGNGDPLAPPAPEDLESIVIKIRASGVEAVAIAFLNAYRNPAHEDSAVAYFRARLPNLYITASTEISREWFEYERTSTAVANAYVGPRADGYLARFEQRLAGEHFGGHFFMMGSNGGILSIKRSKQQPLALVESGPIGGCIGAAAYSSALNIERMIAFDMGGTTAKCALIEQHSFDVQNTYHVGGYEYGFPVQTPVLDIVEVGTGGGSIAYVDEQSRLHVGPRSAGSDPGPVCFGRGGVEPTVTDANLVLGRIGSGAFLGGTLNLNGAAAGRAISDKVGEPLGYGRSGEPIKEASGIVELANAQMASAIKEITIERGKDIRDFTLFAFGGGGPLHGVSLARELRIRRVIVPPEPGNFSALGMLLADARVDETTTFLCDLVVGEAPAFHSPLADLKRRVTEILNRDFPNSPVEFDYHAELRYKGQRHAIGISFVEQDTALDIRRHFLQAYERRYGRADTEGAIEFIGLRVTGISRTERPALKSLHRAGTNGTAAPSSRRQAYFAELG